MSGNSMRRAIKIHFVFSFKCDIQQKRTENSENGLKCGIDNTPGYKPLLHCPQPTTTNVSSHHITEIYSVVLSFAFFCWPNPAPCLPAPLFAGSIPNTCHISFIWCAHAVPRSKIPFARTHFLSSANDTQPPIDEMECSQKQI